MAVMKPTMSGWYSVLDITAMLRGVRQEVWHGWGWSPEKHAAFVEQSPSILDAVRKPLTGFRIFVADVGTEKRVREPVAAASRGSCWSSAVATSYA